MMCGVTLFFSLGSYYSDKHANPTTCCIASNAPVYIEWGSCTDPDSSINSNPYVPYGYRIHCPTPVTSYILTFIGGGLLILYMAGMIYAMLWSRSISFQRRFYFAPEFSILFVHGFRAGKWKTALAGTMCALIFAITEIIIFVMLILQYGTWYCYDWDAPLSTMQIYCTGSISTEAVFTAWLRAWPFIVTNIVACVGMILLHIMVYKEIHIPVKKIAP